MIAKIKNCAYRNASSYRNFDWQPLKIKNGKFYTYCINMYGITHQNERVKLHTQIQRGNGGWGGGGWNPWENCKAIGFLWDTGPFERQLDPSVK